MVDNNFNELLTHTLKQIATRLDRLEAKVDEKTNRTHQDNVDNNIARINCCPDRIDGHLNRIELEIKRLPWIISAEFVCFGVFLIFLKLF